MFEPRDPNKPDAPKSDKKPEAKPAPKAEAKPAPKSEAPKAAAKPAAKPASKVEKPVKQAAAKREKATPFTLPRLKAEWQTGVIAFGVAVALVSILPVITGFALVADNDTRNHLLSGDKLEPAQLGNFINARRDLSIVWKTSQVYDDLTQALSTRAEETGLLKKESHQDLIAAIAAQREALARNPANTYGWSRLASLHLLAHGPSSLVSRALLLSIQSAPFEPRLMVGRIVTLMRTEPYWDQDLREIAEEQMRFAWLPFYRHDMTKAALVNGFIDRLYAALKDDPDGIKALIELETKYRPWYKMSPVDRSNYL